MQHLHTINHKDRAALKHLHTCSKSRDKQHMASCVFVMLMQAADFTHFWSAPVPYAWPGPAQHCTLKVSHQLSCSRRAPPGFTDQRQRECMGVTAGQVPTPACQHESPHSSEQGTNARLPCAATAMSCRRLLRQGLPPAGMLQLGVRPLGSPHSPLGKPPSRPLGVPYPAHQPRTPR